MEVPPPTAPPVLLLTDGAMVSAVVPPPVGVVDSPGVGIPVPAKVDTLAPPELPAFGVVEAARETVSLGSGATGAIEKPIIPVLAAGVVG